MIQKHVTEGGLWVEDALRLKSNAHVKNLKISFGIDGYHLCAEYDLVIYCPRCGGTEIKSKINDHYCEEFECECSARWVNEMDFMLWQEGGDEMMKKLRGVEDVEG